MPDPDKRDLRKMKAVLKRKGSKHRRRDFKRTLTENPEEAAHAEENLGRFSTDPMNGMDQDSTRKREDEDV